MSRKTLQSRKTQPRLESLEDRKLLYATLGAGWTFGERITLSLVPDGTDIGGQPSALFSSLSSRGISASAAQTAFNKAAAAWQAVSNINMVFVADNGASFASSGNQQGDANFGDIRIGGTALASGVLATSFLPSPFNGGTLAGDIVFNTSQAWQINSDFDLQTVAIHEIGHSLGMDHSAISSATMFASYTGMKQSLTSDDIAGIVSIYGSRVNDSFDAAASNGSWASASNLNSYIDVNKQVRLEDLDIRTTTDADWFVINAPAGSSGTLTVTMQSSDLSLLSPRVTLFNSALQTLGNASAPNSYGSTVTTTFTGVVPGQKFYVRALAASGGTSGIGAFGLLVNFGTASMSPITPPDTTVASQPDEGGGSINQGHGHDHDHHEHVWVGNLTAKGDSFESFGRPGRRDPSRPTAFEFDQDGSSVREWFAMFAPPAFEFLTTIETSERREALHEAIDDLLESWGE